MINLKPGDLIQYQDEVTGKIDDGIVVFMEQDIEYPLLLYVYLKSEKKELNIHKDSRCEPYWNIITLSIMDERLRG